MSDLGDVRRAAEDLESSFAGHLEKNFDLTRQLVSFQANKAAAEYRWFKYKEGFSASLIHYILDAFSLTSGRLLDPFAGAGTSLFAAAERGMDTVGIELLPIGAEIMEVRKSTTSVEVRARVERVIDRWRKRRPWRTEKEVKPFPHLRITAGAFSPETEDALARYLAAVAKERDPDAKRLLRFAALCVLEDISYTRKDGQYLRWDSRSERGLGKRPFSKGPIKPFEVAIQEKLTEVYADLGGSQNFFSFIKPTSRQGDVEILNGSCLNVLPTLESSTFDAIITSPPYCNRYDYTRTYALELALLGVGEQKLSNLRQEMMSCTVENRDKVGLRELGSPELYDRALKAFETQTALQSILSYLDAQRVQLELNNPGIPRMVRNYFLELSIIIFECARVLRPDAPLVMVNDNVRYQGAIIPVDLILSDIAAKAGLVVEKIWVLPNGKGNSSQQMGEHGREELRKCVYVWRRSKGSRAKQQGRAVAPAA